MSVVQAPDPLPGEGEGAVATETGGHRQQGRAAMTAGDRVRLVLRGIGQTLITGGLIVLLFVVYEVYITNYFAHREQSKVHNALEQVWANGRDPLGLPGAGGVGIPLGEGIANIYIPRLGRDFAFTIVQGSTVPTDAELEKGPAHYRDTALPGGVGNFSVAGHRVGKGEPFLNLDQVKAGDMVIIETKTSWFVYQVLGKNGDLSQPDANGVPGREIVSPSDGNVLLPVPDHPNQPAKATDRYLTMTTCHPKFTATQRMVVHAALVSNLTTPRTGSTMPDAINALYNAKGL
jgi:sortase A